MSSSKKNDFFCSNTLKFVLSHPFFFLVSVLFGRKMVYVSPLFRVCPSCAHRGGREELLCLGLILDIAIG